MKTLKRSEWLVTPYAAPRLATLTAMDFKRLLPAPGDE